jgi:hypothetical protein
MTALLEEAHRKAARTSVSKIAAELQEIVGQRQVAFAVGIRSSKEVGRWANAESKPRVETDARLRNLYRVVEALRNSGEEPETIRAWMLGANPSLEEKAPIEIFKEGGWTDVLGAAELFIAHD